MYTLLLVEDEKIELETLKNYVDWAAAGIDRVLTARGGRSALELMNAEEVDLLITDIEMPGISGIELVDIIRQEGHQCKVIFLTGYDRFEYAKEAIRLQVDEFLLKPFQIEEVEQAVRKLLEKIEKERREKEFHKLALGKLIEKACLGEDEDLQNMASYYYQKPADQVQLNLMALRGLDSEHENLILNMNEVLHAFARDGVFIVILPAAFAYHLMKVKLERIPELESCQIIFFRKPVYLSCLREACEKLICCEDDLFYLDNGHTFWCEEHVERKEYEDRIRIMPKKGVLLEAVLAGEKQAAADALEQCLQVLKDMKRYGFCQNAFSLYLYIHRQLESLGNLDDQIKAPEILKGNSYEEIRSGFYAYIVACCELLKDMRSSRWSSYVKQFVMSHYMGDCTVEEMAEGLGVTPNYLRRKFKEETNMTILEYLTDTRLSMAAHMLEQKDQKVKDVSVAVGYPNISYFTQLFSKKYGVTPNEYKKMV